MDYATPQAPAPKKILVGTRDLLTLWNPPWGFYRLTARGKSFRTLWTGPLMIGIVFSAFYFPCRHVGLSIIYPLATAGVLLLPWAHQLLMTAAMWRDEAEAKEQSTDPADHS